MKPIRDFYNGIEEKVGRVGAVCYLTGFSLMAGSFFYYLGFMPKSLGNSVNNREVTNVSQQRMSYEELNESHLKRTADILLAGGLLTSVGMNIRKN